MDLFSMLLNWQEDEGVGLIQVSRMPLSMAKTHSSVFPSAIDLC